MHKPIPIIYLEHHDDQERLFRLIWSPTNTYGGLYTDSVDEAWDEWQPSPRIIFSYGTGIDGYNMDLDWYHQRLYFKDCTPMNSINHFAEYLRLNRGFFKTRDRIYGS